MKKNIRKLLLLTFCFYLSGCYTIGYIGGSATRHYIGAENKIENKNINIKNKKTTLKNVIFDKHLYT